MLTRILALKSVGVPVSIVRLLRMWLRKSLTEDLAHALMINHKAGVNWPVDELETHAVAGGNVKDVVTAAAGLHAIGADYTRRKLLDIDLILGRAPELVIAFAEAHRDTPDLTFDAFADRHLQDEDFIRSVRSQAQKPPGAPPPATSG
ncbi:MAG: hypothetical protein GWN99_16310 [Gemmatimonadetes bacterium]|uniref:Uncharacterized protein n=1 Tax=Candidatus Kutchimonas denitrificans TaxID=3056748 RepID=A0AAE4Z7Y4_9BACT|nr:hypothetical protein [Gemmatimonadota bacterium]NIR74352.1 hypothetical protein [Candidatus Kutchimonas denitrificans]NIS02603.1 hypothetical protein [Gemmatimonadota bacterium]NIT68478.1 hypothetical protein [Gemmatimonadota bacterium]NIU51955.1 hypothetical protein [Gemmatimonadota bacterium]